MRSGIIKDIFIHPKKAFVEIDGNSEKYFAPAIGVLIFLSISAMIGDFSGIWNGMYDEETTKEPIDYSYTLIITLGSTFLGTGLMLWVARKMYKVETTYKRIFSTLQFAGLPYSILSIPVSIIIGFYLMNTVQEMSLEFLYNMMIMPFLMLIPLWIHLVILSIIAAKQSFQLSTLQVIAVWIVSGIIIIIIFIPVGIVLGVLGAFNVF